MKCQCGLYGYGTQTPKLPKRILSKVLNSRIRYVNHALFFIFFPFVSLFL